MNKWEQKTNNITTENKVTLYSLIKGQIDSENYPQALLKTISTRIYPVQSSLNIYVSLAKNIENYISIQLTKGLTYDVVIQEIIRKASYVSEQISNKLKSILEMEQVKTKMINSFSIKQKHTSTLNPLDQLAKKAQSRKILEVGAQLNNNFQKQTKELTPAMIAASYMKDKKITINNLCMDKYRCLCQKQVTECQKSFKCLNCQGAYHRQCMKRQKYCTFCYMKKMNPLKNTLKEVFVGLLMKGRQKHEIHINFKQDLRNKEVQIRCMRLKHNEKGLTSNLNLFPDACSVIVNNKMIRQFTPLHKQSSLKFRRDDPININRFLVSGHNQISINERFQQNKKELKDERIELQNHLLGIYIFSRKKVQEILTQAALNEFEFNESKKLLEDSFLQEDQVSLDKVKTSLCCSMTLQPLEYPARTTFCNHFAVFDLKNFILLNSKAQIPKWLCPICKQPAHEFRIDPIFNVLLKEGIRYKKQLTEVVFQRNGEFRLYSKNQPLTGQEWYKSIYDLPIESKYKRFDEERPQEMGSLRKKKNKNFILPAECQIVQISQ